MSITYRGNIIYKTRRYSNIKRIHSENEYCIIQKYGKMSHAKVSKQKCFLGF